MVDIQILEKEIVERLKPLDPDKIILFRSYAYGKLDEVSDIDLFWVKDDLEISHMRIYKLELQKRLFDIQRKCLVGVDLFVDSTSRMQKHIREIKDQFYNEILQNGKIIYAK